MDVCFQSNNVHISSMSFVDDVVVFGEASLSNVRQMLKVIDLFCKHLGQKINYTKSQFITSNNITSELFHYLTLEKGFRLHDTNIKYLSFPFILNARHTRMKHSLVDRMALKIDSWTHKPLPKQENW